MKILYIYKSIALLAGMERILTDKMNYLADYLKYDVYLITYEQGEHPISYPLSAQVKHIDLQSCFYVNSKYSLLKHILLYLRMRKIFKKKLNEAVQTINPDVIVSTNYSYPQLDILVDLPVKSKRILEIHLSKHAILKSSEYGRYSPLRLAASIYDYYMISQIKKFDLLVTLTESDKKQWGNIVNTAVIPNVLTKYPEDASLLNEKKIIGVGRFEPQKGYDLLIQAWKKVAIIHPDWQVHLFGNGFQRSTLQNMIKDARLEDSFFLNSVTSDIYSEYLKHSIFVLSSRYEGFGLVLIEAMSCGLPCVSFDCPSGPSEIIRDGEDGILVENGNIEKMSKAICYFIENEEKRLQMGAKARKNSLRFVQENIMPRWDALFKSL